MSCEVLEKIGTGDCEKKLHCSNNSDLAEIIASELVSEILENALDIVEECEQEKPTAKVVGDILENLACKFQEMNISEDHKIATKQSCEKEGNCLKGLGDQLEGEEEIIQDETSHRHPPVEKKNRLTDLVKNSKHVLAKLILSERKDSLEGKHERVIRIVEPNTNGSFKVKKKIMPENIPLPRNDSHELLEQTIEEETMDEIQLYMPAEEKGEGKGDVYKKTLTFPLAAGSGKSLSLAARCRTLKFPVELKKKKWNFGTKIINYIRKSKKDEVKDGVEIQPKTDND